MTQKLTTLVNSEPSKKFILLPFALGIVCLGFALLCEILGLLFFGPATALNHPPMFEILGNAFLMSFQLGSLCLIAGISLSLLKVAIRLYQKLEQLSLTPEESPEANTEQPSS